MGRLIDVDFAIAEMYRDDEKTGTDMWQTGEVEDFLDGISTVDAAPVVHGEWVVCGDGEYVPFMCSACGKTTSWYHAQTANYCPNCGAKMDGGDKCST